MIKVERNCPLTFTAKQTKPFTFRVWRLVYWERGQPKPTTVRVYRKRLACAAGPGHRAAMKRRWGRSRAAYTQHRERKLAERRAERERLRYLPYDCGSTRSAIRCDIMWCESGGSYTAENSSGAFGRYQLMPEWWSHLGRKPTPPEQDRIASELWNGGAGRSNWVC